MKDFKKRIVFDEAKEQEQLATLSTKQLFDEKTSFTSISTVNEDSTEQEMAAILTPKKKSWGMRFLASAGIGLTLWQSVDNLINAAANQDWLSLGWSGFLASIALLGGAALVREFHTLSQLKGRQDTRIKLQAIVEANGIGKAKAECERLAKQSQSELSAGFDKWQHALAATHNDKEVFELYDSFVLAGQDKEAKAIVAKHAVENAVMVAVSPLAIVDMLLVAWRSIYLIEHVAKSYGITLGYWSRIRLLRLVLLNMALAGATEVVSDASAELFSVGIAGKLSSRAAQGLGIGLLTARLGFKAIELMRPLPHLSSQAPKLADVRRALLGKLTS